MHEKKPKLETATRRYRYRIQEGSLKYGMVYVAHPDYIVAKSRSRKGLCCKRA